MSIQPGINVASARSTTSSPAAPARKPSSIAAMRPPSTTTVTRSRTVSETPSIRRPACRSVTAPAGPAQALSNEPRTMRATRVMGDPLVRLRGDGFDRQELDLEHQRRIRGNEPVLDVAAAVGERRRDHELALAADLHARHALLPALDHVAAAERERERLVAVARAVELLAAA